MDPYILYLGSITTSNYKFTIFIRFVKQLFHFYSKGNYLFVNIYMPIPAAIVRFSESTYSV